MNFNGDLLIHSQGLGLHTNKRSGSSSSWCREGALGEALDTLTHSTAIAIVIVAREEINEEFSIALSQMVTVS